VANTKQFFKSGHGLEKNETRAADSFCAHAMASEDPVFVVKEARKDISSKRDVPDDKAHTYIYYAVDGANRMRQIILDLLEFSRVGKYNGSLKEVSLNGVVKEVRQPLRRRIEDRKATIIANNLPIFHTYHTPLVPIMQNLITNAIKYCAVQSAYWGRGKGK
jgi:light-regulated signal transduction histidine kinase (bacteriophytochrome)